MDIRDLDPGSIRALLSCLGQRPRQEHKVLAYWNLPRAGDNPQVRLDKSQWFIRRFFGNLGCRRTQVFYNGFVTETISEIKTNLIQQMMKRVAHKAHDFNQELAPLVSSGLVDQSVLLLVPFVQATRGAILSLQDS